MLSRTDIKNELGKGINIYPFNSNNLKENSINLCTGNYAWTLGNSRIYINREEKKFSLLKSEGFLEEYTLYKSKSAIISLNETEKYIMILPQSTTLIETKEILATGPNIGGTYHSKVGLVSMGLGHIGTMLGPNFSGHSLVAFHNITSELIVLKVGESFVSVVFHYLNTPLIDKNPTISGHVDKLSELGITLSSEERQDLLADWKLDSGKVRDVMKDSSEFKAFKEGLKKQRWNNFRSIFNIQNILNFLILISIIVVLIILSLYLDKKFNTKEWSNRCFNIIGSGVFVTILAGIIKSMKKR